MALFNGIMGLMVLFDYGFLLLKGCFVLFLAVLINIVGIIEQGLEM